MLDVAQRESAGMNIDWVQSPARIFRPHKRFDLVIMTGNAFQVLLDKL